jgi:hypothetical protein
MAAETVKWFNDSKGSGFVTPEGGEEDLFVQATSPETASHQRTSFRPLSDRSAPASRSSLSLALEGAAIPAPEEEGDGVTLFGKLEIAHSEVHWLSNAMIVERLVDSGVSRLSAERIVAVQRGEVEPGRARRHAHAPRAL